MSNPYFHSASLSARFNQDIKEALNASRISDAQGLWLARLVDTSEPLPDSAPLPRVDKLLIGDATPDHAELASAWMISDTAVATAPVFLSTLLGGIERFADRVALLDTLCQRFVLGQVAASALEAERLDGALFEQRTLTILKQQSRHLDNVHNELHELPTLHTALGHALQEQPIFKRVSPQINVFSHLLQIVKDVEHSGQGPATEHVSGTQSLAQAAFDLFSGRTLHPTLRRRFLDAQGQVLNVDQASPYVQALAATPAALSNTYEWLLSEYWMTTRADGLSRRDIMTRALAESLRHTLLHERAAGSLSAAEYRVLGALADGGAGVAVDQPILLERVALKVADREPVKLAGMILIGFDLEQQPRLFLYSASHGLRRVESKKKLIEILVDEANHSELLCHTSLNDHPVIQIQGERSLHLEPLELPWALKLMDSIIALHKRNLAQVLTLQSIPPLHAPVRVDDALDVRALIDCRLLYLHDAGRWRPGMWHFGQIWSASTLPVHLAGSPAKAHSDFVEESDGVVLENTGGWFDQIRTLEALIERQSQLHEGPAGCVRHILNRHLASFGITALDARDLWVRYADQGEKALIDVALERVSAFNRMPLPVGSHLETRSLNAGSSTVVAALGLELIETLLVLVQNSFERFYNRQLQRFHTRALRWLDMQINPGELAVITRERALRFGLAMERRLDDQNEDTDIQEMLGQALDRPVRALRRSDGPRPLEVHTLRYRQGRQPAVSWTNTFVLRPGSDNKRIAMWSVYTGLQGYNSLADLDTSLNYRLRYHEWFEHWLQLLSLEERQTLRRYLADFDSPPLQIEVNVIHGHFIQAQQQAEFERNRLEVKGMLQRVGKWQLDASLMRHVLERAESSDINRLQLNDVATLLDSLLSTLSLPEWVRTASLRDLTILHWLVRHFMQVFHRQPDYLFGIPDLADYAREQLKAQFEADYPGRNLDPDQIKITFTHFTAGPVGLGEIPSGLAAATRKRTESLTSFAIDRFAYGQDGIFGLEKPPGSSMNDIDLDALKNLVRSLDVVRKYRDMLESRFSLDDKDLAVRQGYFCRQMPLTEMLRAIKLKMSNQLSYQAFVFISATLVMPDGLARIPVFGCNVIISPLQLWLEDFELEPDVVIGAYVIAPQEPERGPWVLYMLLTEGPVFREYADREKLLADLYTDTTLQGYILARLDDSARKRYDHGGFTEPHLPFSTESLGDVPLQTPKPVVLKITPWQGSALQLLFEGTVQTLKLLARRQGTSTRENDQLSSHYLLTLGAEQVLALLPGRAGFLVSLWQSKDLFYESLRSSSQDEWGKALLEFITALGVLLSGLEAADSQPDAQPQADGRMEAQPELEVESDEAPLAFPVFNWGNDMLTPDLQIRLRQFEAHDVVLNTLQKDPLNNVYTDLETDKRYAAVQGRVYQILLGAQNSFIVIDDRVGPCIKLNENLQWGLDLQGGLRGGGGMVSRIREPRRNADIDVDSMMTVQAQGMPEILHKYRDKAQYITLAHEQARTYLENCLDNLTVDDRTQDLDAKSKRIIGDFFGVNEPDTALCNTIDDKVRALYRALIDPSLSPYDSPRFVVGLNNLGNESPTAFTFVHDLQARIFLTEKFFLVPPFRLKTRVWRAGNFNYGTHHRAVILLHELSHLYCNTDDIAYVDANAPFIDMLEDATVYRRRVRDEVISVQQRTLSHLSDRGELFRQADEGIWYDLRGRDGSAKRTVLDVTGMKTLEKARDVFYTDAQRRSEVLLKNADSVALLISLLGREKFAS